MDAGILGEESVRGEILIEVRLIEQISWSLGERNQNLASTFWRRLWGPEQKASVDSKKRSEASGKAMEAGGSSSQGGDMRLSDSVTLREIASEAREKAMFDRMERMEKHMETLTTIQHELQSERRGTQEERVRGGGVTPGPDSMRRSQTTERFGGERGNISLRGEFRREEEQSPPR